MEITIKQENHWYSAELIVVLYRSDIEIAEALIRVGILSQEIIDGIEVSYRWELAKKQPNNATTQEIDIIVNMHETDEDGEAKADLDKCRTILKKAAERVHDAIAEYQMFKKFMAAHALLNKEK